MKVKGNIQANAANEIASYVVDTGAADAYIVATRPAITAYTAGLVVSVKITNANTGASTLAVDGLSAIPIKKNVSTALVAGDLPANKVVDFVYDGTNFQIMSIATTSVPISGLTAATGTNDINNAAFGQIWRWNSLAGGIGLNLSSNSTAATGNSQSILTVELSGANANSAQTTYAATFSNTHTGTDSINYGISVLSQAGIQNRAGAFTSSFSAPTSLVNSYGIFGNMILSGNHSYAAILSAGIIGAISIISSADYSYTASHILSGIRAIAYVDGAGSTADQLIAMRASGVINNSATVGNLYGIYIDTPDMSSGGAITNNFGLRIEDQKPSGVTNSFGVYQMGSTDTNYFAGTSGFGTPSPSTLLHVNGAAGFRYVDGNQASDKFLRSDANGVASWVTLGSVGVPISSLTAATGGNSIDNGAETQNWNWNTLANAQGLYLYSNSTAAAGDGQQLFRAELTGVNANTNQTTHAITTINTHTGTNAINVGISATATSGVNSYAGKFSASATGSQAFAIYAITSGSATNNYGGYFNASGGTNNYAIIVPSGGGSVGIGTSTPGAKLDVQGSGSVFVQSILNTSDAFGLVVAGTSTDGAKQIFQVLGGAGGATERFGVYGNGNVGIGQSSPTALLHIVGGGTGGAQIRLAPGVAPSSPNDGDIYYINTNDRLMFFKNATACEVISASAVTTEAVVTDTTLTITFNGTTYKLCAKA